MGFRTRGRINKIPSEVTGTGKTTGNRVSRAAALSETVKGHPAGVLFGLSAYHRHQETSSFFFFMYRMSFSSLRFRFSAAHKIHVWPQLPSISEFVFQLRLQSHYSIIPIPGS